MGDGEDVDPVTGRQVGDVIGKPQHRRSPHQQFSGESFDGHAGVRPCDRALDRAVDSSEELQPETGTLLVVPDGGGFKLRRASAWRVTVPVTRRSAER